MPTNLLKDTIPLAKVFIEKDFETYKNLQDKEIVRLLKELGSYIHKKLQKLNTLIHLSLSKFA